MDFIAKGTIVTVLPQQSGTSQSSGKEWVKQSFVLEHEHGQYPRSLCFDVFGADKIQQMNIQQGEELTVHLNIECREYQGKYYNSIGCWRVEREPQSAVSNGVVYAQQPTQTGLFPPVQEVQPQGQATDMADDLPFD